MSSEALICLQEGAEQTLVSLFEDTMMCDTCKLHHYFGQGYPTCETNTFGLGIHVVKLVVLCSCMQNLGHNVSRYVYIL